MNHQQMKLMLSKSGQGISIHLRQLINCAISRRQVENGNLLITMNISQQIIPFNQKIQFMKANCKQAIIIHERSQQPMNHWRAQFT